MKITFLGAGSTVFAKNVLGDVFLCSALDPAPGGKNSEPEGSPAHHAQAEPSVGRATPQTVHSLPAGCSQVSQFAEALFRSGETKSVLGDGHHVHSASQRYAVYVCDTGLVRQGCSGVEDRLRYVFFAGHRHDP